ncbi:MAG: FAD-dependent monooxygenase, partial [Actinomycetota bacterium]|nr:FAD-dependent monooxygenase [Actinomycetota bacterium]
MLVVGGGPGGAAAAYWLARRGFEVVVVEKKTYPRDKTCGDGLTPRAIRQLLDMGFDFDRSDTHRIIGLRDTWTRKAEPAPQPETSQQVETEAEVVEGTRSEARDRARAENPTLQAAFQRYTAELGLEEQDADLLSGDLVTTAFFDAALVVHNNSQSVANWINNALQSELKDTSIDTLAFGGAEFGKLVALVDAKTISNNQGKQVLAEMLANGGDPEAIVAARGMTQISDADALIPIIDQIMADNPDKVSDYRSGRTGLLGFFMGQVMRSTGGKANP